MQSLSRSLFSPGKSASAIRTFVALLILQGVCLPQTAVQQPAAGPQPPAAPQQNILPYIKNAWNTLGRSMNECSSISDPKFGAGATSVLYLPYFVTPPPAVAALSKCGVKVGNLPKTTIDSPRYWSGRRRVLRHMGAPVHAIPRGAILE